jgi:hypothetical protein
MTWGREVLSASAGCVGGVWGGGGHADTYSAFYRLDRDPQEDTQGVQLTPWTPYLSRPANDPHPPRV